MANKIRQKINMKNYVASEPKRKDVMSIASAKRTIKSQISKRKSIMDSFNE